MSDSIATLHGDPSHERAARPIAVVLNGAAGALLSHADAMATVKATFHRGGLDPEFIPLDAGSLPQRIEMARRMDPSAVVVAGGDGTIACAAQVLAGTATPLGILPYGTMNLLAKDLHIPVGAPDAAVRIISRGHLREIDVAEVNGSVFLCTSMIGLPVRLGRFREAERRRRHGFRMWTRVAIAALRLMRHYFPRRFILGLDGTEIELRAAAIAISANAVDQPPGRPLGRGGLDHGELAVYVLERLWPRDAARLSLNFLRGTWHQMPILREFRARHVTVGSRRAALRIMNDGECLLMAPPLEYRIRPKSLRVFVPE